MILNAEAVDDNKAKEAAKCVAGKWLGKEIPGQDVFFSGLVPIASSFH